MSTSFWGKKISRISFLTDESKANFVASKPFLWLKRNDRILQCRYFNESCLCTKMISLEDNDTGNLETVINGLIWISTDQFNNLHVKQAAGWESDLMFNSFAAVWVAEQPFYPLILLRCYPQTRQYLSLTEPSSNKAQIPAFILLLHCEGLLTPPSQSSNLHAEGQHGLEGPQKSKRLCWIFIHRSNYYYFFNYCWLSLFDQTLRC